MDDKNFSKETAQEWVDVIENASNSAREKDLYPLLRKWVQATDPQSILDIGCGQGVCSEKIDMQGRTYLGVDPSPFLLERAQTLYPASQRKFVLGNAYALPLPAASVDAAFSIAVWHLLEDKAKAASELSRVLKDGGSFLIAAANPNTYDLWAGTYAHQKREGLRFEGTLRLQDGSESTDVLYFHSYEEILNSLEEVGLQVGAVTRFRTVMLLEGQKLRASAPAVS